MDFFFLFRLIPRCCYWVVVIVVVCWITIVPWARSPQSSLRVGWWLFLGHNTVTCHYLISQLLFSATIYMSNKRLNFFWLLLSWWHVDSPLLYLLFHFLFWLNITTLPGWLPSRSESIGQTADKNSYVVAVGPTVVLLLTLDNNVYDDETIYLRSMKQKKVSW